MDIIGFFEGRVTLCGDSRQSAAILNLLMRENIPYEKFLTCREGEQVQFTLSERNAKRLLCLCEEIGICLSVCDRSGLPQLFLRYGRRGGIWVGALVATVLVYASSQVVWDIRITGNETLDAREIRSMLSESGLEIGTYLRDFDNDLVETKLLLNHREISWISINIKGTTANVEIQETVRGESGETNAANLVAARDGQIERVEAYDGSVCVKVGDVVRKGEVLVSGLYDGVGSLRTTRARGEIYARTVREFFVEIPLEGIEKVYTGREWSEKYINFFSNRIKVFTNTGNAGATCDIIYYNSKLGIPGGVSLPIGTETVCYREYREEPALLDGQTAMEKAFSELERQLEAFVTEAGAELLSKTVEYELDETAYRIRCTVVCIENIAETREIDID